MKQIPYLYLAVKFEDDWWEDGSNRNDVRQVTAESIEGEIGFFKLQDWWLSTFTNEERVHIEDVFSPLEITVELDGEFAGRRKPLTQGDISSTTATAAGLLSGLAGWFNKAEDRSIAKRIIQKAYQEAKQGTDIVDLHFTLQAMIGTYYRDRDNDPAALDQAIKACQEQIQVAPQAALAFKLGDFPEGLPFHVGYDQLRVICKKQGDYAKALALCEQARKQGWGGDWNKKIEELTRLANRKMPKGR